MVAEVFTVAIARSGKEDGVAILFAGDLVTFDGVAGGVFHASPCPRAVVRVGKFGEVLLGRHTAGTSPVHTGGIVCNFKEGLSVGGVVLGNVVS